MKAKDILVIGLAAALSAGATSLIWPSGSVANASNPAVLTLTQDAPAIQHKGALFKLVSAGKRFKAGDKPTYRLQVTDLSGQPSRIPVKLALASQFPASPMSRVAIIPQPRWKDELLVGVVPGRTRSFRIQPGVALEAGQETVLTLRVGSEQVRSVRLVLAPEGRANGPVAPLANLMQQRLKG